MTMPMRTVVCVCCLTGVAFAFACRPSGGSGAAGVDAGGGGAANSGATNSGNRGPGGAFDSCSVVTQAEASKAIGETVSAGVLGSAVVEGGLACVFYGPSAPTPHDPNRPQADTVRVVVVKGSEASTWYNDYKSKSHGQPVSGYGNEAFYDGFASLSVMKGDAYLRIAVGRGNAGPSLPDEEALAKVILPKL